MHAARLLQTITEKSCPSVHKLRSRCLFDVVTSLIDCGQLWISALASAGKALLVGDFWVALAGAVVCASTVKTPLPTTGAASADALSTSEFSSTPLVVARFLVPRNPCPT